jgi:hypothetical protein
MMPIATAPVFTQIPQVEWGTIATANTAKDGTGTVVTVFTADPTYGSKVDFLKVKGLGTNVATVIRIFENNGSENSVAANNILLGEMTIAATTLSEVAALLETNIFTLGFGLPPGHKINITIGTTVASGLAVSCYGGKLLAAS